jgi:hypothetical protein
MGFAEEFRAPGLPTIAPDRYASVLKLQVQDLAKLAGVHRTTVTENPSNARLQGFLRNALKVLTAALEVAGDRDRAIYWFRSVPIPEFDHQTAEELVGMCRTDAVLRYLTSIASGSSG